MSIKIPALLIAMFPVAMWMLPPPWAHASAPSRPPAPCECSIDEPLRALAGEIRAAPTLQRAQELATASTRHARTALGRARWIAPRDGDLERAHAELVDYEVRLRNASSPADVAAEFERTWLERSAGLAVPSVDADVDVEVDGGGCNYSGGEIVAIVLGLILGILPGIILLIILC